MEKKRQPIGVFDSGAGGLSVLKELVRLMPEEDFIFEKAMLSIADVSKFLLTLFAEIVA